MTTVKNKQGMTKDDKARLFLTLEAQTAVLGEQTKTLGELKKAVEKIDRFAYGDAGNEVAGAAADIAWIKRWITAANLKTAWVSGIVVAVGFALKAAWDWISAKK